MPVHEFPKTLHGLTSLLLICWLAIDGLCIKCGQVYRSSPRPTSPSSCFPRVNGLEAVGIDSYQEKDSADVVGAEPCWCAMHTFEKGWQALAASPLLMTCLLKLSHTADLPIPTASRYHQHAIYNLQARKMLYRRPSGLHYGNHILHVVSV